MLSKSQTKKSGYIPGLDGWRAIAIVGVLIAHDQPFTLFGHDFETVRELGAFGVLLFFAISGFLITTRILEEERLCGYFDIKRFYIRRLFRIQPAAIAYLGVVFLLIVFGIEHDRWTGWFAALFMVRNFLPPSLHHELTGHFWTLGLEEQFYILLSIILFFFRKNRVLVLGALYCLVFAIAAMLQHGPLKIGREGDNGGLSDLHYLLLPAFAAALLQWPKVRDFAVKFLQPWAVCLFVFGFPLLHILVSNAVHHRPLSIAGCLWPEEEFLITYGFLLFLLATSTHSQSWTTRLLEMRVPRFIGRISYSLYLWHLLYFLAAVEPSVTNPVLRAFSQRELKWVLAFVTAIISYYLIEKPLVRRGHQLAPPATAGRPELADLPVETRIRTSS